jgi:CBS domain-containing protein
MKIDVVDVLKQTIPFNFLRDDVLEDIGRTSEVKNFPRGAYILKQGKKGPPTLFIVARGSVEIVVADERNEETGVGFRHQHDFFGITSVLTQKSYPASVRALED